MRTGVYKILNLINGKFYIGSSALNIYNRWNTHKWHLVRNNHHNKKLQNSWNKYDGIKGFAFIVLEFCEPEKCIEREQFYIDTLKPALNIRLIAESQLGTSRGLETKLRISKAKKGIPYSEEAKKNMSLSHKGKKHTKDWNENISKGQKGRIQNMNTRLAVAEANRKRVWSSESRQKSSDSHRRLSI